MTVFAALAGAASIPGVALAQIGQAQAAHSPWTLLGSVSPEDQAREAWIRADVFNPASLDTAAMRGLLAQAPMEFTPEAFAQPLAIELPHPDGGFQTFLIVESPVMEPALQAQFPEIRTYVGQGVDDPAASVRLDLTPQGFHAQVLSPDHGSWYIDPYTRGDATLHTSYFKSDLANPHWGNFNCDLFDFGQDDGNGFPARTPRTDALLRTYRVAVACTGEYAAFHGGTVTSAQAAIVTAMNRVTGVYEVEVGVRMTLVANNTQVVFTNSSTDPFSNNDGFSMLGQNQSSMDSRIGSGNYDIGHVFSTGGGGVAGLGVVCRSNNKARGVTGLPAPTGDPFYIDYVAHEMGHQFGANHTFNSSTSSCGGGNRNGSTAYEPGSASTIMGYAGICGSDNVQNNSDPYFHSISFDEIRSYITSGSGGNCDVTINTGNNAPDVNAGPNYTIPSRTPFLLAPTSVSDADSGDVLSVGWEQRNLGSSITLASGDNGSSAIIRSRGGTTGLSRSIPPLANVLNNTNAKADIKPTTSRTMTFRAIVRDNHAGGGGIGTDDMTVTSVAAAGPFQITFPNSAMSLEGPITVTWDVAGTTGNGINCANVRISLSTDGGNTFPFELAASTPNDGSQSVTLPAVTTTQARIKIEAVGNIFYDISNANFTIESLINLPIADDFDASGALDPALWVSGLGASVSTQGTGEPSGTNSARLEQTGELRSQPLQIGTFALSNPDIELSFYWQTQGAEASDVLFVEYKDDGVLWQFVGFVQSTGSTDPFQRYAVLLPEGAKFNNYAVRLRAAGDQSNDVWYIDNFRLGVPEVVSCAADWNNSGGQPDSSDFLAFLNDFAAQDPAADLAPAGGDGSWDSSDFLAYLNLYSQGC
jgi:hypothetical protein